MEFKEYWESKPYWLKGGFIGAFVGFLISLIPIIDSFVFLIYFRSFHLSFLDFFALIFTSLAFSMVGFFFGLIYTLIKKIKYNNQNLLMLEKIKNLKCNMLFLSFIGFFIGLAYIWFFNAFILYDFFWELKNFSLNLFRLHFVWVYILLFSFVLSTIYLYKNLRISNDINKGIFGGLIGLISYIIYNSISLFTPTTYIKPTGSIELSLINYFKIYSLQEIVIDFSIFFLIILFFFLCGFYFNKLMKKWYVFTGLFLGLVYLYISDLSFYYFSLFTIHEFIGWNFISGPEALLYSIIMLLSFVTLCILFYNNNYTSIKRGAVFFLLSFLFMLSILGKYWSFYDIISIGSIYALIYLATIFLIGYYWDKTSYILKGILISLIYAVSIYMIVDDGFYGVFAYPAYLISGLIGIWSFWIFLKKIKK